MHLFRKWKVEYRMLICIDVQDGKRQHLSRQWMQAEKLQAAYDTRATVQKNDLQLIYNLKKAK